MKSEYIPGRKIKHTLAERVVGGLIFPTDGVEGRLRGQLKVCHRKSLKVIKLLKVRLEFVKVLLNQESISALVCLLWLLKWEL